MGVGVGAVSDHAGRFRIEGVAAGAVVLRILAPGYRNDTSFVAAGAAGATRTVVVRLVAAPLTIAPVVVTASRHVEAASQAAVSVAVIPGADLLKRNVANIEGALPFVSGATFNGPGQMDVRGSTGSAGGVGSRVLMLLDGHPMLSADGGEIIWEALPLLDVDRVEVVKGAYTAVYGSNALGGVANIITTPIDTQPASIVRMHYDWIQIPGRFSYGAGTPTADGLELQHSQTVGDVGIRLAGYRAPSAIEQFVSAVQFGYRVIPNPDLHGEHSVSGEVGVKASVGGNAHRDVALFQSDCRDLIGPTAASDSVFVFQFRNVRRAHIRGVDASLSTPLVPSWLDARMTYLYLDPVDLATHEWLPYRSRQNATLTLEALGGLAGVDVRYRSRVASVLVYPLDPRSDITVAHLRANYELRGPVVQARVANLFNRVCADAQERTPGQPRTFSVALLRKF